MVSGISIAIWGMIAAKAKTGLAAATSGQTKSAGEALQQAGALIVMIVLASGLNLYGSMDSFSTELTPAEGSSFVAEKP